MAPPPTSLEPVPTLRAVFQAEYGGVPRVFSAPGRVNLIGEHTDYNDGFVLPLAIRQRAYVAARPRADRRLRVFARELGARAETALDAPRAPESPRWLAYVEGVARVLEARGARLGGADLVISSEVPMGAGLSSSAALEVAVGTALTALAGVTVSGVELALAAQAAEHEHVGTRCGIMDQYITALARPNHALLIDCRSLEATAIPAELGAAVLLVCDSRVKHELSSSAYNARRAQCEQGAALLATRLPHVRALRDVTLPELEAAGDLLPSETARRCRHVVTENARTLAASDALRSGNLVTLGQLMNASHDSLARDYEVSCPELDLLVATARSHPGVLGARLTGAGFGGCTISLVDERAVAEVTEWLTRAEHERFGVVPEIFATRAMAGAREES